MGVEKVRKDDTARTFEFLFRFDRVWINNRLLLFCVQVIIDYICMEAFVFVSIQDVPAVHA